MTSPCDEYLVSAAGYKVPDSAFSASSHLAKDNELHFSRLDLQAGLVGFQESRMNSNGSPSI